MYKTYCVNYAEATQQIEALRATEPSFQKIENVCHFSAAVPSQRNKKSDVCGQKKRELSLSGDEGSWAGLTLDRMLKNR